MVKLVDTADLKSAASLIGAYRFDSGSRHHRNATANEALHEKVGYIHVTL